MDLKKQIIEMIESIDDVSALKFIYHFLLERIGK